MDPIPPTPKPKRARRAATPVTPDRGLLSWVAIARDLAPIVAKYRALPKEKREDWPTLVPVVDEALAVLVKHDVTLAEIRALIADSGPLMNLFFF